MSPEATAPSSATVGGAVWHAGATTIECPICHQVYVAIKTPPNLTEALGIHLEAEHGLAAGGSGGLG